MKYYAAAAAGGLLLSTAFPPAGLAATAWIAFVPLFWALGGDIDLSKGSLIGFVFGLGFFGIDVRWVHETLVTHGHFNRGVAAVTCLGLILFLSLFSACFGLVMTHLARLGFGADTAAPFAWVAGEFLRATLFTGFPWDLVGYSQANLLPLVQLADITGVYGVSFVVLIVNSAIWTTVRSIAREESFPWRVVCAACLCLALTLAYGVSRLRQFPETIPGSGSCRIGILQGNIPQDVKWEKTEQLHTFQTYERLGRAAVREGARLLIWPETSVPVVFGESDPTVRHVLEMSSALDASMLVGAPSIRFVGESLRFFNSAFLLERSEAVSKYDKIHLVPFGEYMPLSWLLPLGPGIAARDADYAAGESMTVMQPRDCARFSVLICYEAIFPYLARRAINSGAEILVNITNDGWFGDSAAPYQHLAMAGMRSIENRAWLLRAANTGISAAYDPAGRMVNRIALGQEGFFTVAIPAGPPVGSVYAWVGDLFAGLCLMSVAVMAALGPVRAALTRRRFRS